MTWIRTVSEEEATGPLKELYETDIDHLGFVMQARKAWSVRPDLALAYEAFRLAISCGPGLTLRERRLIHLLVADRVGSMYCALAYGAVLERELGGPEGLRAVVRDHRCAGLSEREVAILDYACALAIGRARQEDVLRLRQVGLDDAEILDVAVTAALLVFAACLYKGVGAEADPFFLEQTDLVEALLATTVAKRSSSPSGL